MLKNMSLLNSFCFYHYNTNFILWLFNSPSVIDYMSVYVYTIHVCVHVDIMLYNISTNILILSTFKTHIFLKYL